MINEILQAFGEVGDRLSALRACEGAAGNISVYIGEALDVATVFPQAEEIHLPVQVPELAQGTLFVTGSGRRIAQLSANPRAGIGTLRVHADGATGTLYTASCCRFARLTSELNSHLAIHARRVAAGATFHALAHSHPFHLTYISHIAAYQNGREFNRRLLRWQPELIINFPEGIGVLPFAPPGSQGLMDSALAGMERHRAILWSHHGLMTRSEHSLHAACDLVEYAETAAHYEVTNLLSGGQAAGLSKEQIREVCALFNIEQTIY